MNPFSGAFRFPTLIACCALLAVNTPITTAQSEFASLYPDGSPGLEGFASDVDVCGDTLAIASKAMENSSTGAVFVFTRDG